MRTLVVVVVGPLLAGCVAVLSGPDEPVIRALTLLGHHQQPIQPAPSIVCRAECLLVCARLIAGWEKIYV